MATKTIQTFFSDLSGDAIESDNPTVSFSIDGTSYEIDLSEKEVEKFRKALEPYIEVARKSRGGRRPGGRASNGPSPKEIREWAAEQKIEVPARGRIPASVAEAFRDAH